MCKTPKILSFSPSYTGILLYLRSSILDNISDTLFFISTANNTMEYIDDKNTTFTLLFRNNMVEKEI